MHPSSLPKETNPLASYRQCASPSSVVVAVSVYYLIGPHFHFWPHSGNTLCLTSYKFPAFNILTKLLSSLSVLNTFFSCFLFFLFARFLVLDLFLINRMCLFWGHNINLFLCMKSFSFRFTLFMFRTNNPKTFFLGFIDPGTLPLLVCSDCHNNFLPYFLSPIFTYLEIFFTWSHEIDIVKFCDILIFFFHVSCLLHCCI